MTAPAAPIRSSVVGAIGRRPEIANSTISAATPSAQSAAIAAPSKPAARQSRAEKP
jgi:hypothetical protein